MGIFDWILDYKGMFIILIGGIIAIMIVGTAIGFENWNELGTISGGLGSALGDLVSGIAELAEPIADFFASVVDAFFGWLSSLNGE